MLKLLKLPNGLSTVTRKNFLLNLFDGAVFAFAMGFVSITTVLPVYVKQIGGSNIEIGLIPVIWALGFNLPQIFIANYTSNQPFKKLVIIKTALLQRLPWLLIAIISFIIAQGISTELGIILFFIAFALAAIGGGINLPAWFDLFAKIIPVTIRGKQFAYRMTLGSLLGVGAGWSTKYILDMIGPQYGYTLLFIIGFLITMISYLILIQLVEEEPNNPKEQLKYKEFFRSLPSILKEKSNYRNFLIADAMIIVAIISNSFITVNAIEKFNLPESSVGIFTVVVMISMMIGSLFFGVISDTAGHRINYLFSAVFTLVSCLIAVFANELLVYYLALIFASFTTAIHQVSRLPLIAEIASDKDKAVYVSLTNLITVPFVLSGLLLGWLANIYGYNFLFTLTGIFALIASIWIISKVHEPRKVYN